MVIKLKITAIPPILALLLFSNLACSQNIVKFQRNGKMPNPSTRTDRHVIELSFSDSHNRWQTAEKWRKNEGKNAIYGVRLKSNFRVQFRVFIIGSGWTEWLESEEKYPFSATQPIAAVRFRSGIDLRYRVLNEHRKWSRWTEYGQIAGSDRDGVALVDIQLSVVEKRHPIDPIIKKKKF